MGPSTSPIPIAAPWDLPFVGVYRVSPDLSTLTLLVKDFIFPNGLAFSPDESILYINDTRRMLIRAFDVLSDGALSLLSDRVFCYLTGTRPGFPDGMKADQEGNLYCGGPGGVWIIDPSGLPLGIIQPRRRRHHQPGLGRRGREDAVFHHAPYVGPRADAGCGSGDNT